MTLADRLASEPLRLPGPRCTMCQLWDILNDADLMALEMALADASVTSATIARALTNEGHHMKSITVARHRRGDCAGR